MSLFRLVAKIGIDATEFNAGLKKAESGVSASMASIGSKIAAAFSVAAIASFTKHIVSLTGNIKDMAEQLDITNEQAQVLMRLSAGSGVGVEKYASALAKIKKLQADFAAGDKGAATLAGRLGIDPNQDSFDILKQIGFSEDKAAVIDLLGVKSVVLINSLKSIADMGPMLLIGDDQVDRVDRVAKKVESIKMDMEAYMAMKMADTVEDFEKGKKSMGGGKLAGPAAGVSAVIGSVLDFFGDAFGFDGPSKLNMGRLNLQEALDKRSKSKVADSVKQSMPDGFTMEGRSSELVGPMPRMRGQFSRIDMGDRANVGGFFGPNADLNRSMQRTLASMDQSLKTIEKSVSATVNA